MFYCIVLYSDVSLAFVSCVVAICLVGVLPQKKQNPIRSCYRDNWRDIYPVDNGDKERNVADS